MTKLTLTNHIQTNTTVLENEFIDKYMVNANGEYVKVYLVLLRHLNNPDGIPTISQIADMLDYTEKDVIRALNYWKKQGLLDYETKQASGSDCLTPTDTVSTDQTAGLSSIEQFRSRKEFKELLFVAEQYLGKVLSVTEIDTITYFYETLGMSADLIEYLIEYCVENNHKSIHYIKKVALSWHEQNITTVEQAKSNTILYNKNCYSVLNAFGIKGRAPASSEIAFIKRWNDEYCFCLDIILEACSRTMNTIHKPDFNYTESILKRWLEKGVHTKADIAALDADHIKQKEEKKRKVVPSSRSSSERKNNGKPNNKFNNFDSRSYDMDDLERKLLQQ
ncbi:MAG: DnaD domain protein [Lachnospiraceae bacterium]